MTAEQAMRKLVDVVGVTVENEHPFVFASRDKNGNAYTIYGGPPADVSKMLYELGDLNVTSASVL